ncbi:hypothetical protein EV690_1942 [Celerinatantimonas diazotrophica]|uniref:Uncharacterized protein n=1 Tax=Celerinatantimonas diazotrophica TaxID=412034 RepID=A0A4V2PPQ1_9GAMM|nr:hypothetical protein EV690_1942 [Celerinatantimonas diazotrophica]CAG9296446.1 hypothetical protein CEDIAZO_01597 [Celerinatantimonas diazotrophica]
MTLHEGVNKMLIYVNMLFLTGSFDKSILQLE